MCIKGQIPVRYFISSPQRKPLNELPFQSTAAAEASLALRSLSLLDRKSVRGIFFLFAYSSEVTKYLTLFDLTARSHHSSPDVDSSPLSPLLLPLALNIFLCELPSQPLFSTGEFKSGLCMCVSEWFCRISI